MYCDDEEHRKDLFQEILVQLWKSYPSFRGEAQFSTWLYRVALNVAIQDFRKEKKRRLLFFESYDFREVVDERRNELEDERLKKMYRAISQLDKVERAVVLLHLEGKGHAEIAEIMGITQNYVRVKMTRIRKKISKKIKSK
ncbi:RNA polymerase subunit sigma-70 [Flavilitoribacter nigricans DSM 23189 = NBRC 102662]|uniref:RNA polymerase subunit sigma-70 n=2 Tax=Flavilitoribacter TaxID=2762562 RepID=A0A2D0N552_FLAN2|nr:RNA polymerase subunit sigma-70 [Flavilitoribacter nigricans DSM 23189 = NBRC 102662]